MKFNNLKINSAITKILDLLISIIIVNVVDDICNKQIPLHLLFWLCLISIFKWIIKRNGINYYIHEIKYQRNNILSNYLNSYQNDDISTHLKKLFETDLELFISYESKYKIEVLCCFIAVGYYMFQISISNIFLSFSVLIIGILQGIIPILYEGKFSSNYQKTCIIEEDLENFYYETISHFEKCYFLPTSYLGDMLKEKNNDYLQIGVKSEATAQKYNGLMNGLNVLSQIGICFICLLLANVDMFQLSNMLGVTYLSIKTLSTFYDIFKFFQIRPAAKAAQERINTVTSSTSLKKLGTPHENNTLSLIKGKNGSGKSTLLKKQLLSEPECFFYVPQNDVLLNITPNELFSIYPEMQQNYIKKIFKWNDILSNHFLSTLSSGERKKVVLMCAFMSNRNLYMDEPENALDEDNKYLLVNAIKSYTYKIVISTNSNLYDGLQREEYYVNNA